MTQQNPQLDELRRPAIHALRRWCRRLPVDTAVQWRDRVRRTLSVASALALGIAAQTCFAQAGVVVLQIQITAPTCVVTIDPALLQSRSQLQLDQRCRVVPLSDPVAAARIAQVQLPATANPNTTQAVVQVLYQ